jgi:hypothetical protein
MTEMNETQSAGGNTMDAALRSAADRLGLIAYAFLVTGGRPDWQLILGEPRQDDTGGDRVEARTPQDPFTDTVPFDLDREHELVGGY